MVEIGTTIASTSWQLEEMPKCWKQIPCHSVRMQKQFQHGFSIFGFAKTYELTDFYDEISTVYISYHTFSCNIREGAATYRLVTEYVRLAVSEKPEIVQDLIQQIQETCSAQTDLAEEDFSIEARNPVERLRCIIEAITDAVKETDFQKIWEEYKKDLEQLLERLRGCRNEPSAWEQAK